MYATEKEEISGPTLIDKLNDDCLVEIFLRLPIEKRLEMEEVCVRWQNVAKKAWHDIRKLDFFRDKGKSGELIHDSTPKPNYIKKVLMRSGVNLKSLYLEDVCSSQMLAVIVECCYNIKKIYIDFTHWDVEHLIYLSQLHKLESFKSSCSDSQWLKICLQNIPKTVKKIELHSISDWDPNFSSIFDKFDALNVLVLCDTNLNIDLIEAVSNKQTITKLYLLDCIIEKGLNLLLNLSNLEYLSIYKIHNVNDTFLAALSTKCRKLKSLNLSQNERVSDEGVKELEKLDNLESLTIINMRDSVTDFSIGKLRGIKSLDCSFCQGVEDPGIMELIKNCPYLEELDLQGTSITENTLRLAVSVTKNRTNSVILNIIVDLFWLNFDVEKENNSPFLTIES